MTLFVWQARVYWEDTDGGGVVYHANYLRFLERARTEWLRARGHVQRQLQADAGIVFTVVSMQAQFRRAAQLDDLLFVSCQPSLAGGASVLFEQRIWREREQQVDGELLLEATVRVACVDAANFRPRRLPEALRKDLD